MCDCCSRGRNSALSCPSATLARLCMCIYVYTVTNVLQKATEYCQSFICRFELLTQRAGGHVPGHQAEEAPSSAPSPLRLPCASEVSSFEWRMAVDELIMHLAMQTSRHVSVCLNSKQISTDVCAMYVHCETPIGGKPKRPFVQICSPGRSRRRSAVQPPDMIFTEFGTCFANQHSQGQLSTGVFCCAIIGGQAMVIDKKKCKYGQFA